jgi:general secretion pathway protein C
MLTPAPATWIVRGATFALWAVAAGSAAYWGLKLSGADRSVSAPAVAARQVPPADPVAIARLLGGTTVAGPVSAAAPVASLGSRLQLVGVAAGASSGLGAAVISVDGKPARSFRVGSPIDEAYMLKSVRGRQAAIASQRDGQVVAVLELPQPRLDAGRPANPAVPGASPRTGLPSPQIPVMPAGPLTSVPPQPGAAPNQAPMAAPR